MRREVASDSLDKIASDQSDFPFDVLFQHLQVSRSGVSINTILEETPEKVIARIQVRAFSGPLDCSLPRDELSPRENGR